MLLINIILLVAGMFLNPGFSIIVFTPLLLPLAESIGIDALLKKRQRLVQAGMPILAVVDLEGYLEKHSAVSQDV